MKTIGYYNGEIGEIDDLTISFNDRAVYFGDGVYDAAYSVNYDVMYLDEHIERFYDSARLIDIKISLCKSELKSIILKLVKMLDEGDLFIYFQASRGNAIREHVYSENLLSNVLIMIKPKKILDINKQLKVITLEDNRYYMCNIKSLNLLPNVLAAQKAYENNADEAVFYRNNQVTECSHSNIHIIKNEKLITAPLSKLILPGVTRAHLIKNCRLLGYEVEERAFSISELYEADEIIITAAGILCNEVISINNRQVGCKNKHMLSVIQEKMRIN